MIVTAAEFQQNFSKYLDIVATEDVFITQGGKMIAKVINPRVSAVDSLRGMLADVVPSELDKDVRREERLSKYENNV